MGKSLTVLLGMLFSFTAIADTNLPEVSLTGAQAGTQASGATAVNLDPSQSVQYKMANGLNSPEEQISAVNSTIAAVSNCAKTVADLAFMSHNTPLTAGNGFQRVVDVTQATAEVAVQMRNNVAKRNIVYGASVGKTRSLLGSLKDDLSSMANAVGANTALNFGWTIPNQSLNTYGRTFNYTVVNLTGPGASGATYVKLKWAEGTNAKGQFHPSYIPVIALLPSTEPGLIHYGLGFRKIGSSEVTIKIDDAPSSVNEVKAKLARYNISADGYNFLLGIQPKAGSYKPQEQLARENYAIGSSTGNHSHSVTGHTSAVEFVAD